MGRALALFVAVFAVGACGSGSASDADDQGFVAAVVAAPEGTVAPLTSIASSTGGATIAPTATEAAATTTEVLAAVVAETTTTLLAETTTTVAAVTVARVLDGDTVQLSTGEEVRIIGIDAPEGDACGADWAAIRLSELALDQIVVVQPGTRDELDKYGRTLRYLDVAGVDVGLTLIREGWALARYDSRDGYGEHARESQYVQASDDAAAVRNSGPCFVPPTTVPPTTVPPSTAPPVTVAAPRPLIAVPATTNAPAPATTQQQNVNASYANCDAVRAAGAAPIHVGDPGWQKKFDRDGDGVGCE